MTETLRGCESDAERFERLAELHASVAEWLLEEDQRMRAIERRIAELERAREQEAR